MYDWPEVRWATDALWAAIAGRLRHAGIDAPDELDRTRSSADVWRHPALILSQTCGWPYATQLPDVVQLVATPVYDVEGCDGPLYSSAIVARRGDEGPMLFAEISPIVTLGLDPRAQEIFAPGPGIAPRLPKDEGEGAVPLRGEEGQGVAALARHRVAFNASDSLSGFVALRAELRARGVDPNAVRWIETGSHRASIRAVAEGQADLASIDAVCWSLAREHDRNAADRLAVVAWTPRRPGLPLITSRAGDVQAIRTALGQALESPRTKAARAALHLVSSAVLTSSDYAPIAQLDA